MAQYMVMGRHKDTNEIDILFTWVFDRQSGIERAKKDNKVFGNKYEDFRAIEIKE